MVRHGVRRALAAFIGPDLSGPSGIRRYQPCRQVGTETSEISGFVQQDRSCCEKRQELAALPRNAAAKFFVVESTPTIVPLRSYVKEHLCSACGAPTGRGLTTDHTDHTERCGPRDTTGTSPTRPVTLKRQFRNPVHQPPASPIHHHPRHPRTLSVWSKNSVVQPVFAGCMG